MTIFRFSARSGPAFILLLAACSPATRSDGAEELTNVLRYDSVQQAEEELDAYVRRNFADRGKLERLLLGAGFKKTAEEAECERFDYVSTVTYTATVLLCTDDFSTLLGPPELDER